MDVDADVFKRRVLGSSLPWLIEIFDHSSSACKRVAPTWESAHRTLAKEKVNMGRVHYSTEPSLVHFLASVLAPFQGSISADDLPIVIGVPPSCHDTSCIVRFATELKSSAF